MTVIAFTRARFTPADIAEWDSVAQPKLDRGLWGSVTRMTLRDRDQLVVHFTGLERPVFRFERDGSGHYRLFFNDRRGWYEIGDGASAAECLSVWHGRIPRPRLRAREAEDIA